MDTKPHPNYDLDGDFDHEVTYANTVKHWVLYTLDAFEAEREPDADADTPNPARDMGVYPREIYDFAAGDNSIVFKSIREIQSTLSRMAKDGEPWISESRPVNRRTDSTEWDDADVEFRYRLNEYGRKVLLDLGVPDKLPNRHDFDEDDRALGVKPGHELGWWSDGDYPHYDEEWDISDNDWTELEDRVYAKDTGSYEMINERGYERIGTDLAEAFPDVTFVLTCGPYRQHDLMYAIRDPWKKVVQIDIYSPMALHRSNEEIAANFENLVKDLHKGIRGVEDEYGE